MAVSHRTFAVVRFSVVVVAAMAVVIAVVAAASSRSNACERRYSGYRPAAHCPKAAAKPAVKPASQPASQPAPAPQKTYCVCTPDNDGTFRVRGVTPDIDKALRAAQVLQAEGIQAWAMEMKPVEAKAGGLTLSNGEAAIAIAYNVGKGKVRAAAIGQSGTAEAIAQN